MTLATQSSPIPNGWPCATTAAPVSPMFTWAITKNSSYGWYYIVPGGIWRIHLDQPDGPVIGTLNLNAFQGKRGWIIHEMPIKPVEGHRDLYFTYDNASLQDPLATGVRFDWFYFTNAFPGNHQPGYQEARDEYWSLVNAPMETTPILMDNPPPMHRVTRIFERGSWLSLGDTVSPGTPASLNPFPEGAPANRLGLARWMTDPKNPCLRVHWSTGCGNNFLALASSRLWKTWVVRVQHAVIPHYWSTSLAIHPRRCLEYEKITAYDHAFFYLPAGFAHQRDLSWQPILKHIPGSRSPSASHGRTDSRSGTGAVRSPEPGNVRSSGHALPTRRHLELTLTAV